MVSSPITYTTPDKGPIAIPEPTASESTWVDTLESLLPLLTSNQSLAYSTADFVDTAKATSIEASALLTMNGRQKAAYTAWKSGACTPRAWAFTETKPVSNAKDWGAKRTALARIYGKPDLTAEQTKAWVLANWDMHALWGAVIHVVKAERAACGGHEDRDPLKFVEAVACRKLLKRLAIVTYKKEYPESHVFVKAKAALENRLKAVSAE